MNCPYCNGKGCNADGCEDGIIEDTDICECCHTEQINVKAYCGAPTYEKVWLLCEICANTQLSKAAIYPGQCKDPALYRSIGWIANKILSAIG